VQAGEFGQFIEEEHAIMRQRRLAGPDAKAAANHRGHRGGVMRRTEGAAAAEPGIRQLARDRGDH
jgi:hypothetical protein